MISDPYRSRSTIEIVPRHLQSTPPPELLLAALRGLEAQRDQIDSHIAAVRSVLRTESAPAAAMAPTAAPNSIAPMVAPKPKRRMSAKGRTAIRAALQKRGAEYHAAQAAGAKKATAKKATAQKSAPVKRKTAKAATKVVASLPRKIGKAVR